MIKNEKDVNNNSSDSSVELPELELTQQTEEEQQSIVAMQDGQKNPELGLNPIQATQLSNTSDPATTTTTTQPVDPLPINNVSTTVASIKDNNSAQPSIADDVDLIEKEWVEKAKQIVNQTKDDPRTQNKELNNFKAGYIKKRYNKEMIISKD